MIRTVMRLRLTAGESGSRWESTTVPGRLVKRLMCDRRRSRRAPDAAMALPG